MQSTQLFKKSSSDEMLPKSAFLQEFEFKATKKGALDNLKFAVKDVIDIKGHPTGCGNPTWLSQQQPCDVHAICVEQLLSNGATCVGKAILGEFCSGSLGINYFYGMPLNSKAPERVPGGSSSGSASVVASGLVDFSLGTDVAGSIRVPASFCGVYGFRPSYGIISMGGVKSFSPSFDTIGIFSKNIDILNLVFEVLSGKKHDLDIEKVNNFYVIEDYLALINSEQQKIFQEFIDESCATLNLKPTYIKLKDLHVDADDPNKGVSNIFKTILCAEIWTTLGSWIKNINLEFSKSTFVDFKHMENIDRTFLGESFKRRELYSDSLNKLLFSSNLLCIPTTPDVAPLRNKEFKAVNEFDYDKLRPLVALSSLAKLPQINIPIDKTDMPPIGISLLSGYNHDSFLLNAVKRICAHRNDLDDMFTISEELESK